MKKRVNGPLNHFFVLQNIINVQLIELIDCSTQKLLLKTLNKKKKKGKQP